MKNLYFLFISLLFSVFCVAQPNITKWEISNWTSPEIVVPAEGNFQYYFESLIDEEMNGSGYGYTGINFISVPMDGEYLLYITPESDFKFNFSYEVSYDEVSAFSEVIQWGNINWKPNLSNMFYSCHNLRITATDIPNFSNVTNVTAMFMYCNSLDDIPGINEWDMSNVSQMGFMFFRAEDFNSNLSNWDVSNVINMQGMFDGANNFNGDISGWNTSNVTDISGMFKNAWSFSSDLSNWDVSEVTNMKATFQYAESFNSDLSDWDVSKVQDMSFTFEGTNSFDSDLSNWNVGNVFIMRAMFKGTKLFNSDISLWNVFNVIDMRSMFKSAKKFNQNIGRWNVSNVSEFTGTFLNAEDFDQSLGSWNLSSAYFLEDMLSNSGISCFNYSTTLHGWSLNPDTPNNRYIGVENRQYGDEGEIYRSMLVDMGWMFVGDSYYADCVLKTDENQRDSDIHVFPNPTKDVLYIKSIDDFNLKNVEVFDLTGRRLMNASTNELNVKNLNPGVYILKVLGTNGKTESIKFIRN